MGKPKQIEQPETVQPQVEPPTVVEPQTAGRVKLADPLSSAAGRAWLAKELAAAEAEEANGPGGTGWNYNEARRPEIEERADFLRALNALLK